MRPGDVFIGNDAYAGGGTHLPDIVLGEPIFVRSPPCLPNSAVEYQIPLLIVMYNNRAYYNDWSHRIVMARTRGTDMSRHRNDAERGAADGTDGSTAAKDYRQAQSILIARSAAVS